MGGPSSRDPRWRASLDELSRIARPFKTLARDLRNSPDALLALDDPVVLQVLDDVMAAVSQIKHDILGGRVP